MNKTEASDLLRSSLSSLGRSEHTVRAYVTDLEQYFDWIPNHYATPGVDIGVASLSQACAQAFVNWIRPGTPASTVNRKASTVRVWFRMHDKPDPYRNYSMPKRTRPPAHPLENGRDDLELLIEQAKTAEQRCLVVLCGKIGLRVSEARNVRVNDFTVVSGQRYTTVCGKGSKERTVPVADSAWSVIEERIAELLSGHKRGDHLVPSNPLLIAYSDRGARRILTLIGRAASMEVASHDLRMTFGTVVYGASGDIRATQELLGHSSVETTVGYTGVKERAKIAAVKGAFS